MSKARILIVDDEEQTREVFAELLQRWGYDVDFTSSTFWWDIFALAGDRDVPAHGSTVNGELAAGNAIEVQQIVDEPGLQRDVLGDGFEVGAHRRRPPRIPGRLRGEEQHRVVTPRGRFGHEVEDLVALGDRTADLIVER